MKKYTVTKLITFLMAALLLVSALPISVLAADEFMEIPGATIRYMDADNGIDGEASSGLRFAATVNKTDSAYTKVISDSTYSASNEDVKFGMFIIPTDMLSGGATLNEKTELAVDVEFTKIYAQDEEKVYFMVSLLGIPEEDFDRSFTARLYMKTKNGDAWKYTYSRSSAERTYVKVANQFYLDNRDDSFICGRLDEIFGDYEKYLGDGNTSVTFGVFTDFHYWRDTHIMSILDIDKIMKRFDSAGVDFAIQLGDFCYDWNGSPELMDAYLNNRYDLPAYGVVGNHDLEVRGNDMDNVTPYLNNQNVVWGTKDGKIDPTGAIAYYFYEVNGMRIVCLDTNYSYNPNTKKYEHNKEGSYALPAGNEKEHSLGPTQIAWLKAVLNDAANKKKSCIIMSHQSMSGLIGESPDAPEVRAIFKEVNEKRKGTVLMALNGHLHKNAVGVIDDVVYFNVNIAKLGGAIYDWSINDGHYTDETYEYVKVNPSGKAIGKETRRVTTASRAGQSWYFTDNLNAVVTVTTTGRVIIDGMESTWLGGHKPSFADTAGRDCVIDDGEFNLDLY